MHIRVAILRWLKIVLVVGIALYVAGMAARIYTRKYYVFGPGYVRWLLQPAPEIVDKPTHVFFIFADHFEPYYDVARVRAWSSRYRELAARHHDSDGRAPQHTWFYPGEQESTEILGALRELVGAGLGEVELHYHHDFDTAETFRPKLARAVEDFQRYGFLKTADGQTHFAFVHGNWGLDNSNGPLMCGVNTELRLLHDAGCFADFTFPSIYENSQPPFVNTIYAAEDDDRPRSYARRLPIPALTRGGADLMIFEGPLIFTPSWSVSHLFLDLDDGNVHETVPASPARVDRWVTANVHVPERPDWVFIKVHAHGASTEGDMDAVLGPSFDRSLTHLEQRYNDGRRYRLHYITARQAYNLALAAGSGALGPPERYFDVPIGPYVADGPADSEQTRLVDAHTATRSMTK